MRIYFDDGLIDVYFKAFPLMKEYNQIGVIPVITGCVGKTMYWKAEGNEPECYPKCMTTDQLLELINNGWKIASHTITHRNLDEISREEAEREILESKNWIIENLHVKPIAFAAPNHRITPELKLFAEKYYPFVRNGGEPTFHFPPFTDDSISLGILLERLKKRRIKCE